MANWSDIRNSFTEWLKTQETDYKDSEFRIAHIKYSEQFKLFIENHDDDDDLNMDSFTSSKETISQNRSKEEGKRENSLVEDMIEEYVDGLDKDSEAFKAVDTDGDGKLSRSEKDNFTDKIINAAFDENKDDLSYKDFSCAVQKIESGDLNFLQGVSSSTSTSNSSVPPTTPTEPPEIPELQTVEQALELRTEATDYTPDSTTYKVNSQDIGSTLNEGLFSNNYANMELPDLNTARSVITSEIDIAKGDFDTYKNMYANASKANKTASQYIAQNDQQYKLIIAEYSSNNENIRLYNEQIATYETTIDITSNAIDMLGNTKEATNLGLNATQTQISELRNNLYEYWTDEEGIEHRKTNNEVLEQIKQLEEQENRLQEELSQIAQQLLEHEEVLNKANEELGKAYEGLSNELATSGLLQGEQLENAQAMLKNRRAYKQSFADMKRAQAGMVATESYIQSLSNELNTIDATITEKEKANALNKTSEEKEETAEEDNQQEEKQYPDGNINLEYPTKEELNGANISGLSQFGIGVVSNFQYDETTKKVTGYTYTTSTCTITVNIAEDGSCTYTYKHNISEEPETLTIDDTTIKYGSESNPGYYTESNGRTMMKSQQTLQDGTILNYTTITNMYQGNLKDIEYIESWGTDSDRKRYSEKFAMDSDEENNPNSITRTTTYEASNQKQTAYYNDNGQITKTVEYGPYENNGYRERIENEYTYEEYEENGVTKIRTIITTTSKEVHPSENPSLDRNVAQTQTTIYTQYEADEYGVKTYLTTNYDQHTYMQCNEQKDNSWQCAYYGPEEMQYNLSINFGKISYTEAQQISEDAFKSIIEADNAGANSAEFNTYSTNFVVTKQEDGTWKVEIKS